MDKVIHFDFVRGERLQRAPHFKFPSHFLNQLEIFYPKSASSSYSKMKGVLNRLSRALSSDTSAFASYPDARVEYLVLLGFMKDHHSHLREIGLDISLLRLIRALEPHFEQKEMTRNAETTPALVCAELRYKLNGVLSQELIYVAPSRGGLLNVSVGDSGEPFEFASLDQALHVILAEYQERYGFVLLDKSRLGHKPSKPPRTQRSGSQGQPILRLLK